VAQRGAVDASDGTLAQLTSGQRRANLNRR